MINILASHTPWTNVSFTFNKGEIHALMGENGAGKSTLIKVLTGVHEFESGSIHMAGNSNAIVNHSPQEAQANGISTVYQEVNLCPNLTVAENLFIGREPRKMGMIDWKQMNERSGKLLESLDIHVPPTQMLEECSIAIQQMIAIARAVDMKCRVLILDEPTSFISDIRHKLELLTILRKMAKEKEITVIMSLHEIDLAQKISDKIICVKGDAISHFGAPETIFREDIIRELYEIDNGSFDPCFGSIELPRPEGTPRVFVLAGGGTGIPVFRKLQKENVPFAAGVLYTNDIDYQLARILAMETVTEAPFQEIGDEAFARACELMKSCERVIDTGVPVGMCNRRIEELRAEAKRLGKLAE